MAGGDLMNVGDLVKHTMLKETRQVGVITAWKYKGGTFIRKYKVLWACTQTEEYWFTKKEVEVLCG
jgi:hypothetical protein